MSRSILNDTKGVVTNIAEDDEMPVDASGRRADLVVDPASKFNRMIMGSLNEHAINAVGADVAGHIRRAMGITPTTPRIRKVVETVYQTQRDKFEYSFRYLMGFLELVSPVQYNFFKDEATEEEIFDIVANVAVDGQPYLFINANISPDFSKVLPILRKKKYLETYGPVTWKSQITGQMVKSDSNVLIGSMYIIMLEKIADDASAVSLSKLQVHGMLAQATHADRQNMNLRAQAIQAIGETEGRLLIGHTHPRFVAEWMDISNNPNAQKVIADRIIGDPKPTSIQTMIDRRVMPYGHSKTLQLLRHVATFQGWRMIYRDQRDRSIALSKTVVKKIANIRERFMSSFKMRDR